MTAHGHDLVQSALESRDMDPATRDTVTQLLSPGSEDGFEPANAAQLAPLVYDQLRAIAGRYMQDERPNHTLQPTAVVHEAYLRLVDESRVNWQGQTHFRAVCAKVMRRVLIDYARSRGRARRGGGEKPIALESSVAPLDAGEVDAVELNDALQRLAALDPRQAQVVELRFFGGLSVDEVAGALHVSKRTVESEWTHAKAWLRFALDQRSEQ